MIYNCTAISKQFVAWGYRVDYTIKVCNKEFREPYAFRILYARIFYIAIGGRFQATTKKISKVYGAVFKRTIRFHLVIFLSP